MKLPACVLPGFISLPRLASRIFLPALLISAFLLIGRAPAADENYVVTDIFETTDPDLFYSPSDFNNERMVCGTWTRRPGGGQETERGIFLWRAGVMRHLSPASGNLAFDRSPESVVRMTSVRPDGTVLLVAAARQTTNDSANGPRFIIRTILYTIEADLATFVQPVVSAAPMLGRLSPDVEPPRDIELDSGGGSDLDIAPDGTVCANATLWTSPNTHAQRLFAEGLESTWGTPFGLDRQGFVFGQVNAGTFFSYETPLAGLTPQGGTAQVVWPTPTWISDSISPPTGLAPVAMHGPYRAATPSTNPFQTAVWTTGFAAITQLADFMIQGGLVPARNARNALTFNGHLLGDFFGEAPNVTRRAVAVRSFDGTYTIRTVRDQLADGYLRYPPYANPQSTNPNFEPYLVAINDNRDWLVELWTANFASQKGFYVLQNRPGPGRVLALTNLSQAIEGNDAQLIFQRVLGRSGAAQIRVSFVAGGTAVPGEDFPVGATGVVRWEDGERDTSLGAAGTKSLTLPVIDDADVEDFQETIKVVISDVQGATLEGPTEFLLPLLSHDQPGDPTSTPTATPTPTVAPPPSPSPSTPKAPATTANPSASAAVVRQITATKKQIAAAKQIEDPTARERKLKALQKKLKKLKKQARGF